MIQSQNKKYYPFLDAFRAFSILWVLFHHTNNLFDLRIFFGIFSKPILRIASAGFLGVDMFFVISGFLITGLFLEDLESSIRIKRFYYRRFFKIIPQYFLCVSAGLLIIFIFAPNHKYAISTLASHVFLYQNYMKIIPTLGHTWSIAIEEHFYLFYPILLHIICRVEKNIEHRKLLLFCVFMGLIIFGNFLRYISFVNLDLSKYIFENPTIWYANPTLTHRTHLCFDALLFGCLLKLLEPYFSQKQALEKKNTALIYFIMGILIYVFLICEYKKFIWFFYTLSYVAPGFLIISAITGFAPLKKISENKVLRWVGKNSYGIYLWHYVIQFFFKTIPGHQTHYVLLGLYIFLSIFIGALSTVTIERYFLDLRKKIVP